MYDQHDGEFSSDQGRKTDFNMLCVWYI